MDIGYLFGSTSGRIPRKDWWTGVVILLVIGIIVGFVISFVLGGLFSTAGRILLFLLQLAFAWPSYALSGKRFQDRNKPASFALIGIGLGLLKALLDVVGLTGNPFAPGILDYVFSIAMIIVGLWYLIELGFLKGTAGANDYGPDPLAGSRM